jgi:hypothetical protein
MEFFRIGDLARSQLEIEDYNILAYQYNRKMRPSVTKIVAMTVQLWSHQGYWGINKSRKKVREYTI